MNVSLYLAAARSGWPDLEVPEDDFIRFLAERSGISSPPVAHAADLWLACACALGQRSALEAFQSRFSPIVESVARKRGATPETLADLVQSVLEKLLVAGGGGRPKIADYRGSGSLKSWVASIAVTSLLMVRRSEQRRRELPYDDDASDPEPSDSDPELQYLKRRYRLPVEEAMRLALAELSDRERVLLRLHLCEHLSIDRLGAMYGVNRATAARWIVRARARLLERAREQIRRELRIDEHECDSILNLVDSQLHVSVARYLFI